MKLFPEHLRQNHQVVIVDPDQVAFPSFVGDRPSEQAVSLAVGTPGTFIKYNFTRMVVQQGPQNGI